MPSLAKKQVYCRWRCVFLLVPLVFQACDVEEKVPISEFEIRPVGEEQRYNIVSGLSPEREVQWVYLEEFDRYGDKESESDEEQFRDALVEIKAGGTGFHPLTRHPLDGHDNMGFSIENEMLKVLPGTRCTLRVTVQDAVFTASCRVPEVYAKDVDVEAVEYSYYTEDEEDYYDDYYDEERFRLSVRVSWRDPGGRDNFYSVEAYWVDEANVRRSAHRDEGRTVNTSNASKGKKVRASFANSWSYASQDKSVGSRPILKEDTELGGICLDHHQGTARLPTSR